MTLGTVIRSFASPGSTPAGLAFDGRALWHCDFGTDRIYQIDPETGTVIKALIPPGAFPEGIEVVGGTLWHVDTGVNLIYQLDINTGVIIRSFAGPGGGSSGVGRHLLLVHLYRFEQIAPRQAQPVESNDLHDDGGDIALRPLRHPLALPTAME